MSTLDESLASSPALFSLSSYRLLSGPRREKSSAAIHTVKPCYRNPIFSKPRTPSWDLLDFCKKNDIVL